MTSKDYRIDPEFEARLPAHTQEEHDTLKEKIELEGCKTDSLVVGIIEEKEGHDAILIDGHHTLKICNELNRTPPEPKYMSFPDRDSALWWMIKNQFARRNCDRRVHDYYMGKEYLLEKGQHGGQRRKSAENTEETSSCQNDNLKTAEQIAERNGVSESTVHRNAEFAAAVDAIGEEQGQEAVKDVLSGATGQTKAKVVKAAPKLCRDCRLGTPKKGCAKCKELRKADKPPNIGPKRKKKVGKEEFVPGDAFEGKPETVQETIDRVNGEIDSFCRGLNKYIDENLPSDHWLKNNGCRDTAIQKFKDGCATLRTAKCKCLCPKCSGSKEDNGRKCSPCQGTGRVPRHVHDQTAS